MINRAIYIYMVMSDCTYISNTHVHVRMSVEYFAIEIQVLRNGRFSSLNNRSCGISNVPYVNPLKRLDRTPHSPINLHEEQTATTIFVNPFTINFLRDFNYNFYIH